MTKSLTNTERKSGGSMNIQEIKSFSEQVKQTMPWINGISSNEQYLELALLMDKLVEDYDANQTLIDMLFPVIERYEEEADRFKEFNENIESMSSGAAMLRVIIDQNGLKLRDLPEVGKKSYVSLILSGKRKLNTRHISALSKRFGVPVYMFL